VIIFTHSQAIMKAADIIHVLHDGRLIDSGNYADLNVKIDSYLNSKI
jgi:ABC-type transport system involved in cytochrome bd biosynthesis fused ATPase/permease subunit